MKSSTLTIALLTLTTLSFGQGSLYAASPSQTKALLEEANCTALKKAYSQKYSDSQLKTLLKQTIEQVYFNKPKAVGMTELSASEKTDILQLAKCNKLIDESFFNSLNNKINTPAPLVVKTEVKSEVKSEVRPQVKPEVKIEIKPEIKEEVKENKKTTDDTIVEVTPTPVKQEVSKNQMSEISLVSSNYVDEESCTKLQKSYSAKYNETYFKKLLKQRTIDQFVLELKSPEGRDLANHEQINVLKLARCNKVIDDVVLNLIQTKIAQEKDQISETPRNLPAPSMELEVYLEKKAAVAMMSSIRPEKELTNPFPFKKFPATIQNGQKVTVLERLYALYTPEQIKKMSQLMDLTLNVIDASEVQTQIIFRAETKRENYVVSHTPSDVYRLALRIFTMEKKKILQEYNGSGLPFSNMDILAAASVMGVVSKADINILTSDESFYKKETPFIKKMGKYLLKIGITSAQINPATAPYALVGIILYNSYQEINQAKERIEFENFYFN